MKYGPVIDPLSRTKSKLQCRELHTQSNRCAIRCFYYGAISWAITPDFVECSIWGQMWLLYYDGFEFGRLSSFITGSVWMHGQHTRHLWNQIFYCIGRKMLTVLQWATVQRKKDGAHWNNTEKLVSGFRRLMRFSPLVTKLWKNKITTASEIFFFSQYQSNYKNKNHLNSKSLKSASFFLILKIIQKQVQKQMLIQTSTCSLLFAVPLFISVRLWKGDATLILETGA